MSVLAPTRSWWVLSSYIFTEEMVDDTYYWDTLEWQMTKDLDRLGFHKIGIRSVVCERTLPFTLLTLEAIKGFIS